MMYAALGTLIVAVGLGVASFMPIVVAALLLCLAPAVLCYGFYRLLYIKERLGLVKAPIRVLIIDDDIDSALVTAQAFAEVGCRAQIATTPDRALDYLTYDPPGLVVLDWVLSPALNGHDLLQSAALTLAGDSGKHHANGPLPVVSLSSTPPQSICYADSKYFRALEYWQKPFQLHELVSAADRVAKAIAV